MELFPLNFDRELLAKFEKLRKTDLVLLMSRPFPTYPPRLESMLFRKKGTPLSNRFVSRISTVFEFFLNYFS